MRTIAVPAARLTAPAIAREKRMAARSGDREGDEDGRPVSLEPA